MKKLIMFCMLFLSTNVFADKIICETRAGNAVKSSDEITGVTISEEAKIMKFKNGVLEGIVQYKNERIIQMMIENTQNHTFTQISPKELEQSNTHAGYVFMQDLKNDGQFMEISCEVIK